MSKSFKIIDNDISDGYHTFEELYDHRNLLWINLWLALPPGCKDWYADHYERWDLLVAYLDGNQISYHVPSKFRYLYDGISPSLNSAYVYDGHTSQDVLERLAKFARSQPR